VDFFKIGFSEIGAMQVGSRKVGYNGCIFRPPFIPLFYSGFQQV
jgi:hypothetical protein